MTREDADPGICEDLFTAKIGKQQDNMLFVEGSVSMAYKEVP